MGSTISCLSPKDSPGGNLSKKHPGRAEAIAEYKARKNAGKPKPEQATINVSEQVEPKSIEADRAVVEEKPEDEVKEVEKAEDDVAQEAKEEVEEKAPEVDDILELKKEGAEETVESKEEVDDAKEEATKDGDGEEAKEPMSPEPPVEEKAEGVDDVKEEEIKSDAVVEETQVEDVVAPVEKETEPTPEDEDSDEPTAIASEAIITTPTISPLISARRHIFEMGDDTIPEAKDLLMDVKDPVTGDMVTLAEYRRRQSERAQGVVKVHVEKYESIDEKALKEMETRKLQEESRAKGREGIRHWTVPEPSSPSSPKPTPPKRDFTLQTL